MPPRPPRRVVLVPRSLVPTSPVALPAAALAALAVAVLSGPAGASGPPPTGPDVSSHQHPGGHAIDWKRVHTSGGASFAFVKATEGHTYSNPYFRQDYDATHAQGLVRSAYHYARPALPLTTATQQANDFLSAVGSTSAEGDLPTTLDLEESGGLSSANLVAWAKTFLERVTSVTGRAPLIYTYPYFWRHAMGDSRDFTAYPLWIAHYSSGSSPGPLPGGWQTWTFWQTTSSARVAGIETQVDLSRFNGDAAALQRLASPPSPAAPPPPTLLPLPLPTGLPTPPPA